MYFISIRLKLAPVASEEDVLTRKYPLSLHLVPKLLSLLNSSEGDGGMETPEKPDGSWITIAPLEGNGQNGTFRLTLYGQNALRNAGTLLNACSTHPLLQLGQGNYTITSVDLIHGPWSSVRSWADLTQPSSGSYVHLRFVTPMVMEGPERCLPSSGGDVYFPRPLPLFSSLLERWQRLAGPPLSADMIPFLQGGGCVVADYSLYTQHMALSDGTRAGLVGWIAYTCHRKNAGCRAALHALARLACFTGVGLYTEHGMGATCLLGRG